ncbi:MAG: hypothetical protein F6J98_25535 [Moorea sp. SIO4G2]|uniref:Uncharacterized protein n=1 Tax=Moorena bouillonii PNG TaxID=568701 RepID=A0A1U7N9H2_9CYAN|nr:hypothetical protein [Moorena bouillonii]NEO63610.1 hypothetical protein [Moorena sp. SIO4G2]OLT62596.1 hypothetical protein BJP37_29785 [Moorena bouillonii PNG]
MKNYSRDTHTLETRMINTRIKLPHPPAVGGTGVGGRVTSAEVEGLNKSLVWKKTVKEFLTTADTAHPTTILNRQA